MDGSNISNLVGKAWRAVSALFSVHPGEFISDQEIQRLSCEERETLGEITPKRRREYFEICIKRAQAEGDFQFHFEQLLASVERGSYPEDAQTY